MGKSEKKNKEVKEKAIACDQVTEDSTKVKKEEEENKKKHKVDIYWHQYFYYTSFYSLFYFRTKKVKSQKKDKNNEG